MKSRSLMVFLIVMGSFLFLITGITQVTAGEVGVTPTIVKIGVIPTLSGAAATPGKHILAGIQASVQALNNDEGLFGRKIKLSIEDGQYKPPVTVACVKKLIFRDKVFCVGATTGGPTAIATFPIHQKEKVPLVAPITWSSAMFKPFKRYVFSHSFPYETQGSVLIDYMMKELRAKSPKIGILYQDDDYGQSGLRGVEERLAHYGFKILAKEVYKRQGVEFASQALNLKKAGVDYVVLFSVVRSTHLFLKEARKWDWNPVFLGAAGMTDDKTLELAGDNARNLYGVINLALADDKCPGMLKMKERMEKYQHGEGIFMYTTYGYTAMEILKEGLRLAGKDLTRENLVKALEKLRDFDAEGLMSPISYGPNNRSSGRAAFIVKADVKTKKWVRASDWIMP